MTPKGLSQTATNVHCTLYHLCIYVQCMVQAFTDLEFTHTGKKFICSVTIVIRVQFYCQDLFFAPPPNTHLNNDVFDAFYIF